jgi:hypothetical protein
VVIWAGLRPFGTVISQPAVWTELCRCSVLIACSVTTVFGAEVPDGSWLNSWILGPGRQEPAGQGHPLPPGPFPRGPLLP